MEPCSSTYSMYSKAIFFKTTSKYTGAPMLKEFYDAMIIGCRSTSEVGVQISQLSCYLFLSLSGIDLGFKSPCLRACQVTPLVC